LARPGGSGDWTCGPCSSGPPVTSPEMQLLRGHQLDCGAIGIAQLE
jgi:hypothetical protein